MRLRFGLIELWTVRLLIRAGELSAEAGERILAELLAAYRATAAEFLEAKEGAEAFARIFPTASDGYIGQHVDRQIAAKRAHLKERRFAPWLPCRQEAPPGGD